MAHNLPSLHQDHYHSSHNPQSLEQAHQQQQQPVMDDMMEQILSMPSWNDSSGSSKIPWDYSSISAGMAGLESMVALLNTNSSSNSESKLLPQGSLLDPDDSSVLDGSALISHLKQQQQLDISASSLLNCNAQAGISMHRTSKSSSSLSHANNGTGQQLSGIDNRSDAAAVSSWQQQEGYVTGIPSLPLTFGKSGSLSAVTEALMLGKRIRDDQQPASLMENLSAVSGQDGGIFSTFANTQVGHMQNNTGRTSEQNSTQVHLSQGQPLATVSQQAPAVARPRVRARRGQATDPHSIAERLRRERIAERMKSLQELVPNSNKTDKASMLDEIIDYVKFLQLQVKVLSMSRLGNAGAVSSFMADLPTEDSNKFLAALGQTGGAALQEGISLTERQVAKLMEEDMGSAMQYLQSKGLCLMPIHLASNMNKSKAAAGSHLGPNTTIDMKSLGLHQAMASMSTGSTSRLGKGVENQHDSAAVASAKSTVKNAEDNTQR